MCYFLTFLPYLLFLGEKFNLDLSEDGLRWSLPVHLFDALFYCQTRRVTTFEEGGTASTILGHISDTITTGLTNRHIQRLPHSKISP